MCRQGQEIERVKQMCIGSIGAMNTDVDVLYAQLHLDCAKAMEHHKKHCQICMRVQA